MFCGNDDIVIIISKADGAMLTRSLPITVIQQRDIRSGRKRVQPRFDPLQIPLPAIFSAELDLIFRVALLQQETDRLIGLFQPDRQRSPAAALRG